MRDDFRRSTDLLLNETQRLQGLLWLIGAALDRVLQVTDEQTDVVEGIVEIVSNAGRHLANRGELSRLDQLVLLEAELLLAFMSFGDKAVQRRLAVFESGDVRHHRYDARAFSMLRTEHRSGGGNPHDTLGPRTS